MFNRPAPWIPAAAVVYLVTVYALCSGIASGHPVWVVALEFSAVSASAGTVGVLIGLTARG